MYFRGDLGGRDASWKHGPQTRPANLNWLWISAKQRRVAGTTGPESVGYRDYRGWQDFPGFTEVTGITGIAGTEFPGLPGLPGRGSAGRQQVVAHPAPSRIGRRALPRISTGRTLDKPSARLSSAKLGYGRGVSSIQWGQVCVRIFV